jgi:glycosyltransferase involved in cell wall biosynthesis
MSKERFISVVIPTYNRADQVLFAINSVLAQTYREFEIVVVDDGSTDRTAEHIERLISTISEDEQPAQKIRYFYQSNKGTSEARNKGIAEAKGNWIAFLDSDDIWLPAKLEWQVRAIERFEESCGTYFTDARLIDRVGLNTTAFEHAGRAYQDIMGLIADPLPTLAKAFGGTWLQTFVVRSDLIRKIGGFDADIQFCEDHDLMFRLALNTAFCYINRPLVVIERTNTNIDPAMPARRWDRMNFRLRNQQYMYEKWLQLHEEYPTEVRQIIIENLRAVHSSWANWYLETGQIDHARRAVSAALKYRMTPQLAAKWVLTWTAPRIARKVTGAYSGGGRPLIPD